MVWYNPSTWFKKEEKKTVVNLSPVSQPAVHNIDYGTPTTARTGGVTVVQKVSGGSGTSGSGGGGSSGGTSQFEQTLAQQKEQNENLFQGTSQIKVTEQPKGFQDTSGTRTDLAKKYASQEIHTEPYVKEEIVGVFGTDKFGREIPERKFTYVDPTGFGVQKERPATMEERGLIIEQETALRKSEDANIFEKKITQSKIIASGRKLSAEPFLDADAFQQKLSSEIQKTNLRYGDTTPKETADFIAGTISNFIPETKGALAKDIAIYGIAGGVGAGLRFTEAGLVTVSTKVATKYPKFSSVVTKTPTLYKVAEVGVGAGLTGTYVYDIGKQIAAEEDYAKKGEILGGGIKDFAIVGGGLYGGTRVAEKGLGKLSTLGIKKTIEAEKIIPKEVLSGKESFPLAPREKHLKLFQETKYKYSELSGASEIKLLKGYTGKGTKVPVQKFKELPFSSYEGKAGGFHATGNKFWDKEIIAAKSSSELEGLYTSAYLSKHFLRISGKGSSSLVPTSFKQLFQARGIPRAAYLQPEGFRVSPFKRTAKGYEFVKPIKEGFIDIPKMKTEIEGIARPDESYLFTGRRVKTKVDGVDVGIDIFEYKSSIKKPVIKKTKVKKYSSSDYYTPTRTPVYSTTSSGVLSGLSLLRSSRKSTNSSLKSSSYSPSSYKPKSSKRLSSSRLKSSRKLSSSQKSSILKKSYIPKRNLYKTSSYKISETSLIPKTPKLPSFYFKAQSFKKTKRKRKKASEIKLLSQGFTAKALGLKKLRLT